MSHAHFTQDLAVNVSSPCRSLTEDEKAYLRPKLLHLIEQDDSQVFMAEHLTQPGLSSNNVCAASPRFVLLMPADSCSDSSGILQSGTLRLPQELAIDVDRSSGEAAGVLGDGLC